MPCLRSLEAVRLFGGVYIRALWQPENVLDELRILQELDSLLLNYSSWPLPVPIPRDYIYHLLSCGGPTEAPSHTVTMGTYVSIPYCQANYNVTLDCSVNTTVNGTIIGGLTKGQFQGNPDIAGIGVGVLSL